MSYIPCITKMLINSRSVPMRVCEGVPILEPRFCSQCDHWIYNQVVEEDEPHESVCTMKTGFEQLGDPELTCDGDNDIRDDLCASCQFYKEAEV